MSEEDKQRYTQELESALKEGIKVLENGGNCVDCVEAVVKYLEDVPIFNAGKGSVCNCIGKHELEASIMVGQGAGGCSSAVGLTTVKNPISLVKNILLDPNTKPYIIYSRETAENLAESYGLEKVENSYFFTQKRYNDWRKAQEELKRNIIPEEVKVDEAAGTVGYINIFGNLCSGTSTGGMTNKPVGRIGDTPIIGSGTYANNATCAISATGKGERFIQSVASFDVHALMLYKDYSLSEAMDYVLFHKLKEGDGGLIGVDSKGNVAMGMNCLGMFRAGANSSGFYDVKIWE